MFIVCITYRHLFAMYPNLMKIYIVLIGKVIHKNKYNMLKIKYIHNMIKLILFSRKENFNSIATSY